MDSATGFFKPFARCPGTFLHVPKKKLLAAKTRDILRTFRAPIRLVDLGPGDGEKLTLLIEPLANQQRRVDVDLVDVSPEALQTCAHRFAPWKNVFVHKYCQSYRAGLVSALGQRAIERRLVLLLGSNLGNFEPDDALDLLADIRAHLSPEDGLLVGLDLVKPVWQLLRAYADPLGVTEACTRNALLRLNRELGADFRVETFLHRVEWNEAASSVDIFLESRRAQIVRVAELDLAVGFDAGERIGIERSFKWTPETAQALLTAAGFEAVARWIDEEAGFLNVLATASEQLGRVA